MWLLLLRCADMVDVVVFFFLIGVVAGVGFWVLMMFVVVG